MKTAIINYLDRGERSDSENAFEIHYQALRDAAGQGAVFSVEFRLDDVTVGTVYFEEAE